MAQNDKEGVSCDYDVVVIGAGFAGAIAARDLTDQGHTVLLIEGRDRIGGRTWTTTFPDTDIMVELGGQYIMPAKWPLIVNELERYGVGTGEAPTPLSYPTIMNGTYNAGPFPIPLEQIPDLERAIFYCQQAAARIEPGSPLDHQGVEDLDISLATFLAPLELPPETYDFVVAVFLLNFFRYPEEVSALHALLMLACHDLSAYSLWGEAGTSISGGTIALLSPIVADGGELRLDTRVTSVDQTGEVINVATEGGETITCAAVVVATPMNTWNDIDFVPSLSETKRAASGERHGVERSAKVMVRVRNAPEKPFVLANPGCADGALFICPEGDFENGDQLMPMFGLASLKGDDYHLDFTERASVQHTVSTLLPGAELVEFASHDYNADPFSKGDWVAYRPGRLSRSHSVLGAPEGRIAFATSDVAPKWPMMIEGALESGHRAAHAIGRKLQSAEAAK